MLTILLNILSILGILLLAILGLLLLIILIVLFVPVFYRIKAEKNDDLHICFRANWLLGLIRVFFLYPEPGNLIVKVLFFKIFDSGAEDKPEKSRTIKERRKRTNTRAKKQKSESSEEGSTVHNAGESKDRAQNSEPQDEARQSQTRQAGSRQSEDRRSEAPQQKTGKHEDEQKDGGNQSDSESQNPIEKLRYTIRKICDTIKNIRDNIDHYKEILLCDDTKGLLNHGFIRLGKILKSIRPRKFRADIRFGTGSPDTTGYAYAVYGILCPYLGRKVLIVPDFEQTVLEGELDAAGHITVFKLLWHGLMLVLDRRLKKLIAKLRQED